MNILFICDRDICRGPMAVGILQSKLISNWGLSSQSAGISATEGDAIDPKADTVLEVRNIELQHAARVVTENALAWADLILTMTRNQKFLLISKHPNIADKIYTFQAYVGNPIHDIESPYGDDLFEYQECLRIIEAACDLLVQEILEEPNR
ncbi:MAG: low molecular weight protein arginine phosphatase [Cyanobacteria bacterium P01_F01_bin.4]